MVEKLTQNQVELAMRRLEGWSLDDNALVRRFVFADFNQTFGIMTRIALFAEKTGHHPEWKNVYNRLEIRLTTHDVGGLSELDFTMARAINRYVEEALSLAS